MKKNDLTNVLMIASFAGLAYLLVSKSSPAKTPAASGSASSSANADMGGPNFGVTDNADWND